MDAEPELMVDHITERFNLSYGTIYHYLQEIRKISRFGKWMPFELSLSITNQHLHSFFFNPISTGAVF